MDRGFRLDLRAKAAKHGVVHPFTPLTLQRIDPRPHWYAFACLRDPKPAKQKALARIRRFDRTMPMGALGRAGGAVTVTVNTDLGL